MLCDAKQAVLSCQYLKNGYILIDILENLKALLIHIHNLLNDLGSRSPSNQSSDLY